MDPRTQSRYEDAKNEGVIEYLPSHERSAELEQIGHEEEGLKILRALDAEGWMKVLFPAWTPAKADETKLNTLHDLAAHFLEQGVHPDLSAAQIQLLTAKMQPKDLSALKRAMLRPGFVEEWNHLDSLANGFAKVLLSKQNAKPSAGYKLFKSYDPEAILWLGFTSKDKAVQERFNLFLKVWPEKRQQIPYVLMLEMRITPDLPGYAELVEKIFLELIDGHLGTPEEMRAFLEPHSPPAPAPTPTYKRPRGRRAEARVKERDLEEEEESEEGLAGDDDLGPMGDEDELDLGVLPKGRPDAGSDDEEESDEEEDAEESAPARAGKGKSHAPAPAKKETGKAAKSAPAAKAAPPAKHSAPPAALNSKHAAVPAKAAPAPAKAAPQKPQPASAAKAKPAPAKSVPAKSVSAKAAATAKTAAKKAAPAKAHAPAKLAPRKPLKPAKPATKPKLVKSAGKPSEKPAKKR